MMVTFAGQEVPRSPFEVNVGPYKETKIEVFGPGLVGGIVNHPAVFTVESNGEVGALGRYVFTKVLLIFVDVTVLHNVTDVLRNRVFC